MRLFFLIKKTIGSRFVGLKAPTLDTALFFCEGGEAGRAFARPLETIRFELLVGNRTRGQIPSDRLLRLRIVTHIHVEMVLVDIDHLNAGVLYLHGEGISRFDDLVVIDGAFMVSKKNIIQSIKNLLVIITLKKNILSINLYKTIHYHQKTLKIIKI